MFLVSPLAPPALARGQSRILRKIGTFRDAACRVSTSRFLSSHAIPNREALESTIGEPTQSSSRVVGALRAISSAREPIRGILRFVAIKEAQGPSPLFAS